jgi:tetratricopeptide (TPR) repeat protein
MVERAASEPRYTAFLSYSHKDSAAAARLHRRLESYRLPRRLVGMPSARGRVPERLWPIFRDREELPAATDLSETVREALAQSGALIVLCSPYSAGSLWVAEEVDVFRRLHPDRPILAAVLSGDPPACFPKVLRAFGQDGTWHEPLATDLRREGDGPQLGVLKLIAGVTGVGLDALVQRDAQRRVRRVTAVTAAAVAAMLLMAVLALVALDARREADRQRAEAEGLVEFMLADLRSTLRGRVGELDVMSSVNRRALAYYDAQGDLARLPADSLERRARILQAMAEDEISRGNIRGAVAAIRAAYRTTRAQLARAPDHRRRLLYHAQSEYWLGRIHDLRNEWREARLYYSRYADSAGQLLALAPNDPDALMEMGSSAQNLGTVELEGNGDSAAAQRLYEQAAEWFGRAASARPDDNRAALAQANAYAWLADTFFVRQQWRRSLDFRSKQFAIVDRLRRRQPTDVEIAYRFAAAQNGLARSLEKVGQPARARRHFLDAYATMNRLTGRDPSNSEWLYFRVIIQCGLYYGSGPPGGVSRLEFAERIRSDVATLEAQGDPRAEALSRCVAALS